MIKTNYHTHTHYCDGKGKPKAYAEEAVNRGLAALGFSAHSPYQDSECGIKKSKVPRYIKEIQDLKDQYADKLEIYLGLEIEYYPGFSSAGDEYYDTLPLDYRIGSLHSFFDPGEKRWYAIDYTPAEYNHILNGLNRGVIENFVRTYYAHIRDMIEIGRFDILGHLDLIKKHNRNDAYFSENVAWYREEIGLTLDALKDKGMVLEINTGGISRGYMDTCYPSPWIVGEAFSRDIPMHINADAHSPEAVDFWYDQAREVMVTAGYSEQTQLLGGKWVRTAL